MRLLVVFAWMDAVGDVVDLLLRCTTCCWNYRVGVRTQNMVGIYVPLVQLGKWRKHDIVQCEFAVERRRHLRSSRRRRPALCERQLELVRKLVVVDGEHRHTTHALPHHVIAYHAPTHAPPRTGVCVLACRPVIIYYYQGAYTYL